MANYSNREHNRRYGKIPWSPKNWFGSMSKAFRVPYQRILRRKLNVATKRESLTNSDAAAEERRIRGVARYDWA